jgi:hypothetical protein
VKKKPTKVEESAAHYSAKKTNPAANTPEAADATFKKVTDKIFSERKELLHKLAQ